MPHSNKENGRKYSAAMEIDTAGFSIFSGQLSTSAGPEAIPAAVPITIQPLNERIGTLILHKITC